MSATIRLLTDSSGIIDCRVAESRCPTFQCFRVRRFCEGPRCPPRNERQADHRYIQPRGKVLSGVWRKRIDTVGAFECHVCKKLKPASEGSDGGDDIDPTGTMCDDCWCAKSGRRKVMDIGIMLMQRELAEADLDALFAGIAGKLKWERHPGLVSANGKELSYQVALGDHEWLVNVYSFRAGVNVFSGFYTSLELAAQNLRGWAQAVSGEIGGES